MIEPSEARGRVAGKVALVTGAAQGIGNAAAAALARAGASVLLTDINDQAGEHSARTLSEEGYKAAYSHLDVRDEDQWRAAVDTCIKEHDQACDVLVLNAYASDYRGLLDETLAGWDHTMAVMVRGSFLGLRAVIPHMQAARRGSIILIGSNLALRGTHDAIAYQAAKGATRMLTKNIAVSFAGDGIRANCIHPGAVRTEGVIRDGLVGFQDAFVQQAPMQRPAQPDEIAPLLVYLASDESAYATGGDFVIDGGLTAR